jgi:hypothetical protein
LDFSFRVEEGVVTEMSVNYTADIEGMPTEVIRWDTNHGHVHVHRFWEDGPAQVQDLEDPARPARSYNALLTEIEEDLKRNGAAYRARMEKRSR